MVDERQPVPIRTMLTAIGLVVATYLTLRAIVLLAHIETLLIVAAFFAVVLTPVVDIVKKRFHVSRGPATAIVFILGLGMVAGLLYSFISPLVEQGRQFADNFPTYVSEAREGRGPPATWSSGTTSTNGCATPRTTSRRALATPEAAP